MTENSLPGIARALEQRAAGDIAHALLLLTTEIALLRSDIAILTAIVKHRVLGLQAHGEPSTDLPTETGDKS